MKRRVCRSPDGLIACPGSTLPAGANLDVFDTDGDTALMLGAANGHAGVVQALCKAGASLARLSAEDLRAVVRLLSHG